jgi:hypothetical protein
MSAGARILKYQHFRAYPHPPPVPTTIKIYSDMHTGGVTCDGIVARLGVMELWNAIRSGLGNYADCNGSLHQVGFLRSWWYPDWENLARAIRTFAIPSALAGHTILSARFALYGQSKGDNLGCQPQICVVEAYPDADNNLVNADYQHIGGVPLSNIINYADYVIADFNYFNLNSQGLALIVPGQICRLGLREYKCDISGYEPGWYPSQGSWFEFWDVEINDARMPYLEVTYQ